MSSDVEKTVSAIKDLNETLGELIRYGKEAVAESTEEFVNSKIGKFFGLATAYKSCLQRLGLKSKDELERLISRQSRHSEVRDASSELLDLEHDWDTLLNDVDKQLQGGDRESVQPGQTGPVEVELVDARTGSKTSLEKMLNGEEVSAAGGNVVVVSFGLQDGAELWLKDTKVPFPMLLDSARKVYHTFGLYRSVQKVWGVVSMVYYGEAMLSGKPLPKPYENVHDDTQQMGGDFILDHDGIVRFLYPSQTNTDRPSIDRLIQELKKIQSSP